LWPTSNHVVGVWQTSQIQVEKGTRFPWAWWLPILVIVAQGLLAYDFFTKAVP
jgi:hypothetical protein